MNEQSRKENGNSAAFSLAALILGILAFTGSIGHFWLGPIEPHPKLEDSIADQAVKMRDKVVARLTNDKAPKNTYDQAWNADRIAMAVVAGTSVFSIILSVIGFIRHEPARVVGGAAVLGSTALALQYLVIAIGAIVCALILAAVLNKLDFGL